MGPTEPTLDNHLRQIRNIQYDRTDLEVLLPDRRQKIPGTIINAFGALLQKAHEQAQTGDFCIFSSRLSLLVDGVVRSNDIEGSLEDHILAVCPNRQKEEAQSRPRWAIPLCSGSPPHWVLGWLDFGGRELGICDSVPELGSSYWAEPMLLRVVDKILEFIGSPKIQWGVERWKQTILSPPELERQLDDWSNSLKEAIQAGALQALLKETIIREGRPSDEPKAVGVGLQDDSDDIEFIEPSPMEIDEDNHDRSEDGTRVTRAASVTPRPGLARAHNESDANEDCLTDYESALSKRGKAASGPRKKRKTVDSRKAELENDQWVKTVEAHRIQCKGCTKWYDLRKDRKYDHANWLLHRSRCPNITGFEVKRITVKSEQRSIEEPGEQRGLSYFFQKSTVSRLAESDTSPSPQPTYGRLETLQRSFGGVISSSSTESSGSAILSSSAVSPGNTVSSSGAVSSRGAVSSSGMLLSSTVSYKTKIIKANPSISQIFKPASTKVVSTTTKVLPPIMETRNACQHLTDQKYAEYILRTHTRSLGGVSLTLRARLMRQLFPYKPFPPMKALVDVVGSGNASANKSDDDGANEEQSINVVIRIEVPQEGNRKVKESEWTDGERQRFDKNLKGWARWMVNRGEGWVRSTRCEGTTAEKSGICRPCQELQEDESFKSAVRRKLKESALPNDKQREIHAKREKFSSHTFRDVEGRALQAQLSDPLLFAAWQSLERDDSIGCFLHLYQYAKTGKLAGKNSFTEICQKLKHGIRYPENYLNFMTLLRSYGSNSAQQYAIISEAIGGPSTRHLRRLVANSEDCLQNPHLVFENVARVKRLADSLGYCGPVAYGGDCTKVRKWLSYSNDFGGHILGSIFRLQDCEVDKADDIDVIISLIKKENAWATQTRAILAKIPLPNVPPIVIALIPTNGKDDAELIHTHYMKLQKMAAELNMGMISCAADGAASELAAQSLMDNEASDRPHLHYQYTLYGIDLKAPVFDKTGPLISITDPQHARKTCRNQPQHGTHTASLGRGYLVNRSLVDLYETGTAGLVLRDVQDVDKQDDGAARRMFHPVALTAATTEEHGKREVKDDFIGLFVYLFIFGELFDAWLNRRMTPQDRILAVLRARFFLHIWWSHIKKLSLVYPDLYSTTRSFISPASFNIFNRLCDSLLLLVLAYSRYYPDQPFCPWLLGTELIEHFFGLARMLLPNFTYAELLKLVKHVMLRQRILLLGNFKGQKERTSKSGYLLDYDGSPLSADELRHAHVRLTDGEFNQLVELAFKETSQICKELLRMPIPSLPLVLAPIISLKSRSKRKPKANSEGSDANENLDEDDESEADEIDEDEECSVDEAAASTARDAARYAALAEDYEESVEEAAKVIPILTPGPPIPSIPPPSSTDQTGQTAATSKLLDATGRISVGAMLAARERNQSGTATRSERVIQLDPKFALHRVLHGNKADGSDKLSIREASHRVRIVQDLDSDTTKPKTAREMRWQTTAKDIRRIIPDSVLPNVASKNVTAVNPLRLRSFVIVKNSHRTYIGEVLDIYKKGSSSRHGSILSASTMAGLSYLSVRVFVPLLSHPTCGPNSDGQDSDDSGLSDDSATLTPNFTCRHQGVDLHTHVFVQDVLYHLGTGALTPANGQRGQMILSAVAASRWHSLTKPRVQRLIIRIPGGRMKMD
ncbi:hypothetical protein JAAARDRAFT_207846 [Jaapia argillacea MUCL 33604]|uniref:Ubiquitin-like protease family profile domain-containing protein n=1 Tax=Jaapia argillacea MUCL 33604 TaxID=933084 RepID=A0A067PPR7_9AGAM|nr:hypothetical protein JAAARDRAFT_207846 [Jaapia argillacea MUCL 33604]